MSTPADLDEQVTAVRDALHGLRRTLLDLERTYADLDATALAVDDLGAPATAPEVLESAVDALRAAQTPSELLTQTSTWRNGTPQG